MSHINVYMISFYGYKLLFSFDDWHGFGSGSALKFYIMPFILLKKLCNMNWGILRKEYHKLSGICVSFCHTTKCAFYFLN